MPEYIVTDPTGREHVVTAPDGATQEQALAYAQEQFSPKTEAPTAAQPSAPTPRRRLSDRAEIANVPELISKAGDWVGGKVTDLLAPHVPPEVAGAGGAAWNAATQALPMAISTPSKVANSVAEQFGAASTANPLRAGAEWMMKNAIGASKKSRLSGNADIAAKEMLDRGANVSQGGVDKLSSFMDDVENRITDLVAKYPGATVDKKAVASRVIDEIARIEKTNPMPSSARKAAEGIYDEFISNPLIADKIPVAAAQDFKRGLYATMRDLYGQPTHMPTKAVARGLKEELATSLPGIDKLNAEQQKLIITLKEVASRAATEANKLPVSPFSAISAASGTPAGIALSVAYHAERSAAFRSVLARVLNAAQKPSIGAIEKSAIAGSILNEQP